MGHMDKPFTSETRTASRLPEKVCIVARAAELERLRQAFAPAVPAEFHLVPAEAGEAVSQATIADAAALVIELDPEQPASLRRLAQVREFNGNLPVIVALADADVATVRTLLRQGVNDVTALPFEPSELCNQLIELVASSTASSTPPQPLAPMVAVVRSSGGSGATTVLTHLAAALASRLDHSRPACVIDLDVQFGNVGAALGKTAKSSVMDLLEAGNRLDAELLHSVATDSGRGFDVIVAPEAITPLEMVDNDRLFRLLRVARQQYGSLLVDLPANWTNWALTVALEATDIILIVDLSVTGLRQARRRLELFASVGIGPDKIRLVINRFENRLFRTIGVDEVDETLGLPVYARLASEPAVLHSAQDQGLLAHEVARKNRFSRDTAQLADQLAAGWGA